jgi:hypothetical protein
VIREAGCIYPFEKLEAFVKLSAGRKFVQGCVDRLQEAAIKWSIFLQGASHVVGTLTHDYESAIERN